MNTETPILSDFLTPDELATELRIHPRTLARWEALDEAPPHTVIGRKRLYRRSSVLAWLARRERNRAA